MDTPKTRINSSMLPKHAGQYVCVVGRNMGVESGGTKITLETSDKQKLTAHFSQPQRDPLPTYVELVGKVGPDLSLEVERVVPFGSEFDMEAYNEVVQLSAQFPAIFSPSNSSY